MNPYGPFGLHWLSAQIVSGLRRIYWWKHRPAKGAILLTCGHSGPITDDPTNYREKDLVTCYEHSQPYPALVLLVARYPGNDPEYSEIVGSEGPDYGLPMYNGPDRHLD